MTYSKLQSILPPHSEIHYLSDTDSEYQNKNYNYILFEYTTDWPITIASLDSNNIKYKIKTDDWNLKYILINK